jgi:hypothetical protein
MLNLQPRSIKCRGAGDQFFKEGSLADKDQMQGGVFDQTGNTGRNNAAGTQVPAHCINRDDWSGQGLLVSALVNHFATTVNAFRRYMVAQVNFASALFDRQGVCFQSIVRTTHIAGRAGFFVLLNSHN